MEVRAAGSFERRPMRRVDSKLTRKSCRSAAVLVRTMDFEKVRLGGPAPGGVLPLLSSLPRFSA